MLKLMHVAIQANANKNAGDVALVHATRRCFEHFLGPIDWTLHQLWEPFDASVANQHDGVVVGGGGLLLPDQDGASYEASGWQWNCTLEQLEALDVPLIVFGIGNNTFRGQTWDPHKVGHVSATIGKAAFFSLREREQGTVWVDYQPCPTTCLWQLYPEYRENPSKERWLGINIATDRTQYRFGLGEEERTFDGIADVAEQACRDGWQVAVLCHKTQDMAITPYLSRRRVSYQAYDISGATPEWILQVYQRMSLVIGMRSHSQLIPFGLRRGIIAVISHDKLKRFLDDIEHPEWGWDVREANFANELWNAWEWQKNDPNHFQIDAAQKSCWEVTTANMHRIAGILQREVVCQNFT